MLWTIEFLPRCGHHVFLSHSAEDRETLAFPLFRFLTGRGIRVWLDRHDYPYGRTSRAALRDAIVGCRHVVFLVTDAMLNSARGWCVQELAWAELLQDNLLHEGAPHLVNCLLPLYFVPQDDARLPRTVWQAERDRGAFAPTDADRIAWAAEQILAFLKREEARAFELRKYARTKKTFRDRLKSLSGLTERVTNFDPHRMPRMTPPSTG